MNRKIKALFIVNPFSGPGQHKTLEKHLEKKLSKERFDYEVRYTERAGHATAISRRAQEEGVDLVVAVGGDGTVNEVARPLIGTQTPVGIIPEGSGNGLARHLGISTEIDRAINILNGFSVKTIDTARANDEVFLSIAGVGFDALVAEKYADRQMRGFFRYAFISITEYFPYEPQTFRLVIDGRELEREALFISFANSNQFGYNTIIAPQAKIDDGLIDVCIVKKFPAWVSPFLAPMLLAKKIDQTPYVEIIRGKDVFLKNKHHLINLDGEPVMLKENLHIRVNPASLRIVVPGI